MNELSLRMENISLMMNPGIFEIPPKMYCRGYLEDGLSL